MDETILTAGYYSEGLSDHVYLPEIRDVAQINGVLHFFVFFLISSSGNFAWNRPIWRRRYVHIKINNYDF